MQSTFQLTCFSFPYCFCKLLIPRQFFQSQTFAENVETISIAYNVALLSPEVRHCRIEDAVLNVMGDRSSHSEEYQINKTEYLPAHQAQDMILYPMDLAVVPFANWQSVQHCKVFMVSV